MAFLSIFGVIVGGGTLICFLLIQPGGYPAGFVVCMLGVAAGAYFEYRSKEGY